MRVIQALSALYEVGRPEASSNSMCAASKLS